MESFEHGPEKIQSAAIKVGDRVFTGRDHTEAMIATELELGHDWLDAYADSEIDDGFMTTSGRYVDRGEAAEIARKNEQTNRPYGDGDVLDSNHLK